MSAVRETRKMPATPDLSERDVINGDVNKTGEPFSRCGLPSAAERHALIRNLARNVHELASLSSASASDVDVARDLEHALDHALDMAAIDPSDMPASGYSRKILYADPAGRFTALRLMWSSGAATPVHGHHVWCTFGVVNGCLNEIRMAEATLGKCDASESRIEAGTTTKDLPGEHLHQIRNMNDRLCVSIHIYGIDAKRSSSHVNNIFPDSVLHQTTGHA
jgi:predicted metal-dependent enzyme (double-stranded beta helix superfamily)